MSKPERLREQASTSFFEKKEAKKLLRFWAFGVASSRRFRSKSFLVLFCKKEPASFGPFLA
jgi:hypothetical protein